MVIVYPGDTKPNGAKTSARLCPAVAVGWGDPCSSVG